MSCYHPLLGYYDNYALTNSGKRKVRINSKCDANYIELFKSLNPDVDVFPVPCGQCIGCRLEYSRQWAIRCMLESSLYENNFFLTLTYDNYNVPFVGFNQIDFDFATGEVFEITEDIATNLVPEHFTKFMKDLRAYYSYHFNHENIRFYGCGEYGDNTRRSHFHILCFNLPIPDLMYLKNSNSGSNLYCSKIIEDIWNKGFVVIGDVSFQSCAYVARYIMKKQTGKNSVFYTDRGLTPPFVRMSRRPGIGFEVYNEKKDKFYRFDELILTDSKGLPLKVKPPKYFDRLYEIDNPQRLEEVKAMRKASAENFKPNTTLTPQAYLSVLEDNKICRIKSLVREL